MGEALCAFSNAADPVSVFHHELEAVKLGLQVAKSLRNTVERVLNMGTLLLGMYGMQLVNCKRYNRIVFLISLL